MRGAHGGAALAGKAGYTFGCLVAVLVMVVSGFAYYVKTSVASIGGSNAITGSASTGAMNILLMGLESRTYWSGQPLPHSLTNAMHIGSVGGQATNTLIVLHIFAGGHKAVGFSIPRDDWVTYPQAYDGQTQGKIDQAYGFALAAKEASLAGQGLTQGQIGYLGNEAGRKAEIATVESVTGVKIDHFAELNLLGFYQLAGVFGGITVCVNAVNGGTNLQDANSGFNAIGDGYNVRKGGSQYLHLDAAQSLAFVRERDNLPNGDLDRTHRQQAVVDYVLWKLKNQGAFTDLGQLGALLTVAKQYLVTDSGWNLLDFLPQLEAMSGSNLTFKTLPILGYETIDGQDANVVDTTHIKQVVHAAFYPPANPGASSTLSSTPSHSTAASPSTKALSSDNTAKAGTSGPAAAAALDATASATASATAKTASNTAPSTAASAIAPSPAPSTPAASATSGPEGGAVTVDPNAPYGIPCVN
jgi:LCP family protein required for cell wall assembly